MTNTAFAQELKIYKLHQSEWLANHVGLFVAIQGEHVDGFFSSYAEAFQSGVAHFGVEHEFLIKQVCRTEPVYFVS